MSEPTLFHGAPPDAYGKVYPTQSEASVDEVLAFVRAGVESGTIKGERLDWCKVHRAWAWDQLIGEVSVYSLGYRCHEGAWIEGANAWDCDVVRALVIPVSDGGSET